MRNDLLKIRQLAAAAAWQTPLGDQIYDLVNELLARLDDQPEAVVVALDEHREARTLRAA